MLNWLKSFFKNKSIVQADAVRAVVPTHQVDVRDVETRKRVKKAFEAQESAMKARAMKAHDPSCVDPLTCKKRICFKPVPDKIVSEPYEVKPRQ